MFVSHTIRVLFDPFIATLKISTAITVLLLFLIMTPLHVEFKSDHCEKQAPKNSQVLFFEATKIIICIILRTI